jgi:hypothetical protein
MESKRVREREERINGSRDRALEGFENGEGWKWPLGKKDTRVFQINQMNRINKMSIK